MEFIDDDVKCMMNEIFNREIEGYKDESVHDWEDEKIMEKFVKIEKRAEKGYENENTTYEVGYVEGYWQAFRNMKND